MNDKYFDKIFGNRLREERRFEGEDSDWQRLVARLNTADGADSAAIVGNSNRFRRWLLPMLALLLLLTSGVLFGKLNQLDKTNTALAQQMQTFKTQFSTQHDTIFLTKTDTVFIEQNAAEKSNQNTFIKSKINTAKGLNNAQNAPLFSDNKNSNSDKLNPNNFNSEELISLKEKQLQNEILALKNKINNLENQLQVSENQRLALNSSLNKSELKDNKLWLEKQANTDLINSELINKCTIKNDSLTLIIAEKDALIAKIKAQKNVDSLALNSKIKEVPPLSIAAKKSIKIEKKPTTARLFVGVSAGSIAYKTAWLSPQNLEVFRNEKSYQVGLKAEYALTDKLRLTAEGDYCPFNFQIFWQDSRYNLPTPQHFYPANDKIKSSKAVQQLAQLSFGAKYMFMDGTNRWRPYVGGAYTGMKILPFDAEFEVQNVASGAIRTLTGSSTGITIANLLGLNGGLEYRFNRRFVAQGEAFYNLDLNRPEKTYDLFGLRGALLFNF